MRRRSVTILLTSMLWLLLVTSGAQAVVVDTNPSASGPSVTFPTDVGAYVGVAMVPGTTPDPRTKLSNAGIPTVTTSSSCFALCSHGGPVMHRNETFALVWDPNPEHHYAAPYVEQFLRDVADGSGTLTSPYADRKSVVY